MKAKAFKNGKRAGKRESNMIALTRIVNVRWDTKTSIEKAHEFILAYEHEKALKNENYELCEKIQAEVNRRIETGMINKSALECFRYYNSETEQFEGEYKFDGLNNLFTKAIKR